MITPKVTQIILVRHGETAWNRQQVFRGTADMPLNENGRAQARLLGMGLRDRKIAIAYVSPLLRAVETAEIALGQRGVKIVQDERLKDFCYGDWQGLEEVEVKQRWPKEYESWVSRPESICVPGGNTLAEVFQAAFGAMEEIAAKHRGETVVILAHRVVNKLLVLGALGLGLERFSFIRQDNCCIDVFEWSEQGYVLVSINDTSHLHGHGVDLLAMDF
ncbi:histidine phosphatase family protein [Planctomycetota bacterium]